MFQLSVGGPAALLTQLGTTVSVTHWRRIKLHDYFSKQALSISVYSLTHIHTVQSNADSIGEHYRIVTQLVFFLLSRHQKIHSSWWCQDHSQEPADKMFIKNADLRNPRHHHELFLRSRPFRGELPTVAGFLLYPDTPAKMETTSQDAFCFRPVSQHDRGKGDHITLHTQQESLRSHPTSSRQTGREKSSRGCKPGEDEEGNHDQTAGTKEQDTSKMQSQYQKDFPPPSSCCRRRTPALPQPDNIGINPAFRIDFNTVQRENYPGWPVIGPMCAGKLRAASSGKPNI
ncbi:uncharacterized protein si:dkeyp-69c1.9 isoform X1 [Etheostoma cragini]|uniref:uncharacterized protein si:dkeyp-69c1.9 isoform X1 n=2 Tax=Etheostoma cragini TaxID=417921 RepID=UPI00155F4129|nr:uncharacterized protein si:dkeyp-69c1.9 isoform X1 [Etheostoma cragini]